MEHSTGVNEAWMVWEKGRKGRLFFPTNDIRSAPTLAVLSLLSDMMTGPMGSELKAMRSVTPDESWGEVEALAAALMMISSRLNEEDYLVWIQNCIHTTTVIRAAAWTQRYPKRWQEQLALHGQTPPGLLSHLYDRYEQEGARAWDQALALVDLDPRIYKRWLEDGRPLEEGWQHQLWEKLSPLGVYPADLPEWTHYLPWMLLSLAVLLMIKAFGISVLNPSIAILIACGLMVLMEHRLTGSSQALELQWGSPEQRDPLPNLNLTEPAPMSSSFDQRTLQLTLLFMALQVAVFLFSTLAVNKLKRSEGNAETKMKLLENDDTLFDLGLYIGLAGTVLSFLFILLGSDKQGMLAAYTSTLFGIIEVALFKITVLRPYRQQLIHQLS
jgi:hypothetical protein